MSMMTFVRIVGGRGWIEIDNTINRGRNEAEGY